MVCLLSNQSNDTEENDMDPFGFAKPQHLRSGANNAQRSTKQAA